jgi:hypothetical protein
VRSLLFGGDPLKRACIVASAVSANQSIEAIQQHEEENLVNQYLEEVEQKKQRPDPLTHQADDEEDRTVI